MSPKNVGARNMIQTYKLKVKALPRCKQECCMCTGYCSDYEGGADVST